MENNNKYLVTLNNDIELIIDHENLLKIAKLILPCGDDIVLDYQLWTLRDDQELIIEQGFWNLVITTTVFSPCKRADELVYVQA